MNTDHAIVEEKGHVMVITLNRPEKRNALSPGMLVTIYEAWRKLDEDSNLRCAVLTGAGGTFCSGADLSAMKDGNEDSEMSGIRGLTKNYSLNNIKNLHLKVIFQELKEFDKELEIHSNIENEILFPRALKLQDKISNELRNVSFLN